MSILDPLASFTQGIAAFSNPFGAPSNGEWNLSHGIYTTKVSQKSIVFFYETPKGEPPTQKTAVDQISDSGGRRLAIYEYPYRDGQRVADLGRKGETFTFNIKFHGQNYLTKFQEFLSIVVDSNEPGILTHPVRSGNSNGSIPVKFRDWDFLHRYDEFNAVTIKATFIEDNTDALANANLPAASQDSALRSALQALTDTQSFIASTISTVGADLLLPAAITAGMKTRLASISSQISGLLGSLAATYSTDAQIQALVAQAGSVTGGINKLTAGTVLEQTSGGSQAAQLPPVYQVGFDSATQTQITAQITSYVNANQISPQQAVYLANSARSSISAAIAEVETNFGNGGYDIEIAYRSLSVTIQQAVESSLSSAQSLVTLYTTPVDMSLRQIAFLNGLTPDDQNALEALNPYLASVNLVPEGTQVTVPVAS